MKTHRARLVIASVLAMLAVSAGSAHASAYTDVLRTYEQAGTIPPCAFSSSKLAAALKGVDTYGAQYFADFTTAIQTALTARAGGQCASTPAHAAKDTLTGLATRASVPASVTAATNADLPAPILLMALLGAAMALIAATVSLFRIRGWDPAWAAWWQHAWSEAGHRVSGTWAEFVDWLRSA